MASVVANYRYLVSNPKSSYKQLFIKGTRIRARVLYGCYASEEEPRTVEQIAVDFDLPVDAVKEAIAYCESDPLELREDAAREEAMMEASGMNDPGYRYHPLPKRLAPQEAACIHREVEARFTAGSESAGE